MKKVHSAASELPQGLGMALAKNLDAMQRFTNLPSAEQDAIIAHTRTIQSKQEMESYVNQMFPNSSV